MFLELFLQENHCNYNEPLKAFCFPFRAVEVRQHSYFASLDWKLVELLKVRSRVARHSHPSLWILTLSFFVWIPLCYYSCRTSRVFEPTPVVQRLINAIHPINHYSADSVVCFVNTYPLDSDLCSG